MLLFECYPAETYHAKYSANGQKTTKLSVIYNKNNEKRQQPVCKEQTSVFEIQLNI